MNNHDRENVKFLLSLNPEQIAEWQKQQSPNDIRYAGEILVKYKKELDIKLNLLTDREIKNTKEADEVIRKFTK